MSKNAINISDPLEGNDNFFFNIVAGFYKAAKGITPFQIFILVFINT